MCGGQNFVLPAEWSACAKRGGDPVLLNPQGQPTLDASPIFEVVDGQKRCLDTNVIVGQRGAACVALAVSFEQSAGLHRAAADRLVRSIFAQPHPDNRYAGTTVLDPEMLRAAAALLEDGETARLLGTFVARGAPDRYHELLELEKQIVALESTRSSNSSSSSMTSETTSSPALQKLQYTFSVFLLAHLRLARTAGQLPPNDSTRRILRTGLRAADAQTIGALLIELKPYAEVIYGPVNEQRAFKELAEDMATVRMPEEFIRDSQILTARISEAMAADRFIMKALEELACYVVARTWTPEMRESMLLRGELDLGNGEQLSIRDDDRAREILRGVVKLVNEIICREYDISLLPLRFVPREGEASADKQTAGEYNIESKDIYLNLDYVLKEPGAGNPEGAGARGLIGTLAHEITHAYQHALVLGTTRYRLPPAFRDARAIFDFNFTNYAPEARVFLFHYRGQPVERHAHYVGYTVQRNLEHVLRSRGARWGMGSELSEERRGIVNAWSHSSTEPSPKSLPENEVQAMGLGAIRPRDPDTIPPWQRSPEETGKPGSADKEASDSDTKDSMVS